MRLVTADLHVHSALSPCADDDMTPERIVYAAVAAELDMIAICDHNCAGNAGAVQQAAEAIAGDFLRVIPGMEITTREEVHILGLFPDVEQAMKASDELAAHLPGVGPHGNPCGNQPLMDCAGRITGTVDRLLSFASSLSLTEAVMLVRRCNGLVIAAHVDRPSFSVMSQLGFIPDNVAFDALEISEAGCARGQQHKFSPSGLTLITGSDAHFLQNIGDARTCFLLENPNLHEIALAMRGTNGRGCRIA